MTAPRDQAVINGHDAANATAVRTLQNYIGGRWVASESTRFGEVRNPANDELLEKDVACRRRQACRRLFWQPSRVAGSSHR